MTSGIIPFIFLVFLLVVLASYALHCGAIAQDAQEANVALHKRLSEAERKLDKRTHQMVDLMVENYELHNLVNQAHGRGFIPQQFKQGRQN